MFAHHRVIIVIPSFNVARWIERVLQTLPWSWVDHAIVVDDASHDDTAAIVDRLAHRQVALLRHEQNSGVGAAIATGYQHALTLGADVVVVMAGDGQMDPNDLEAIVSPIVEGHADYTKGNRLLHPDVVTVMPSTRLVGNLALSFLTRLATGLGHVGDSQCGYTAVHARVLRSLDARALWRRYGYPNHLLGALALRGFRVQDVVVRPIYRGERSGVRVKDALWTIPSILLRVAAARLDLGIRVLGHLQEFATLREARGMHE